MTYQVLARKWRPRDFDALVGQTHVAQALVNALDSQRLHHAFLFTGTRGVGKTTLARILAKCLNCETGVSSKPCGKCSTCLEIDEGRHVDLIEVDAASRAKVDETRDLMDNVQFAPARGRYKVYLIDEVHMFSTHSFNALLKTLEEPPPHVKFLLATTDPQKLPVTVLSRCLQFNLKRLAPDLISAHLTRLMSAENTEFEPSALRVIAKAADGSMRDALSLLDQAIAHGAGRVIEANVRDMLGTLEDGQIVVLLDALVRADSSEVMRIVAEIAESVVDFESVLQELLGALQRIAAFQLVPELSDYDDEAQSLRALGTQVAPEDVQLFYEIAMKSVAHFALATDHRSVFEMTLLRMLAFRPAVVAPLIPTPAPAKTKKGDLSKSKKDSSAQGPAAEIDVPSEATQASSEAAPVFQAALSDAQRGETTNADFSKLTPESWPEIIDAMGAQGLARELALNSIPTQVEADRVTLALSPRHEYLNRKSVAAQLHDAIQRYFDADIRVAVMLEEPVEATPASVKRKRDDERQRQAENALQNDPNVNALQDVFGAVLDSGSIRPVDG